MSPIKESLKIAAILLALTVLFYWKILLTPHQFSLLLSLEGANQAFAWLNFCVATLRQGNWPIWDPYTFSGHSFVGEMQTGAFYPPYLFFLLGIPFRHHGVIPVELYNIFFAFTHFLGAWFMYLLARELGLSTFAGLISGICFSFGGIVARIEHWPHLLGSAIWLPLILLFLCKALRSKVHKLIIGWATFAGLSFALAILAGGLHIVIMEALVVASAAIYFAAVHRTSPATPGTPGEARRVWIHAGVVLTICFAFGLAGAAIQLLPSAEYSRQAVRFLGEGMPPQPATAKIPYAYMADAPGPQSLFTFIIEWLPGSMGLGEWLSPSVSVFAFFLVVIAVWRCWSNQLVRYFFGLALVTVLYLFGPFSFLHGLLYAVTPFLWMARETDRFYYIVDFAFAILAGVGMDAIFARLETDSWKPMKLALRWVMLAALFALAYPLIVGHYDMNQWVSLALVLVMISCALFYYILAGNTGLWVRFLVIALILFDLGSFDWSAANIVQTQAKKEDYLEPLVHTEGVASFLHSLPGPFRVQVGPEHRTNIGDLYDVETIMGAGATLPSGYLELVGHPDLLNVWYDIRPSSATEPGAIFNDSFWKVYGTPHAYPRAWLTHNARIEMDSSKVLDLLNDPQVDLHQTALVDAPVAPVLNESCDGGEDRVVYRRVRNNKLEVDVHSCGRAMLVLSEMFYPGWKATVNGRGSRIWKVDGGLRGVEVSSGDSRIEMRYAPASIYLGAVLTAIAFLMGGFFGLSLWRNAR